MIGSLFLTSLLYFVLLLSLCQVLCGKVYATNKSPPVVAATTTSKNNNNIELFKTGSIEVNFNSTGTAEKKSCNVNNYYSPVVVSAGDVIVALTGVNRTSDNSNDNNNNNVTIVTKYIEIEKKNEEDWGAQILTSSSSGDNGKWKSQFAVQHKIGNIDGDTSVVRGMLAAAKNDKIYVLLVNCSNKKNGDSNNDANCDFNITVGTVTGETNAKKITWADGKLEKTTNIEESVKTIKEEKLKLYPSGGTAFTTKDNKVVFVVLIANDEKKKNIFVVIYSEGDKTETKFKVLKEENVEGCTPVFFSWGENKIIMMPTHCTGDNGKNQKVKESSDTEIKWSYSTWSFARLLGFMQDKNNFTTTTINGSNILLFTQKRSTSNDSQTKNIVYVWFSDGNRVHNAGTIVTDHNITSSNLLHTNNELFALHQNWDDNGQQKNITLTRLEEQLKKITLVVTAWKVTDRTVLKLFNDITELLETSRFTDGLVGFLSDTREGNKEEWKDEYYYTNATVREGTKVNNGITFNGRGAGAKWPVGKQKEDQTYNFTDPGFTLLANVTIDGGVSDKDNSVLGVVYNENDKTQKTFGLWCTAKGEWKLTGNGGRSENIVANGKQCNKGGAYLVTIVLNKSELSVRIDGEELSGSEKNKVGKTHNITHFYFGVNDQTATNNDDESHVTVRNVLLYNRPFTKDEVGKLKIPKERKLPKTTNDSIDDKKDNGNSNFHGGNETTRDKGGDESASQSSRTGEGEENSTSQPENSTVRGGYVDVFVCFLMLAHALCFL